MIRIFKFITVGGINTAITLVTFYFLNNVYGMNYLLGSFLGYSLGIINSYILNKLWTFRDSDKKVIPQFMRFVAVSMISMGINLTVMYILIERLNLDSLFSQVIAIIFSTVSNYTGSRILVFHYSEEDNPSTS